MIAARKKNRLKMKYPMQLWPCQPATRAGQNAIAIQMTASKIHQRTGHDRLLSALAWNAHARCGTAAPTRNDVAAPGRSAHHPGITPERVIWGDRDRWPGAPRRPRGLRVPASTLVFAPPRRRPGIISPGSVISPAVKPRFHDRRIAGIWWHGSAALPTGCRAGARRVASSSGLTGHIVLCRTLPEFCQKSDSLKRPAWIH
jgi:hypothetical protein